MEERRVRKRQERALGFISFHTISEVFGNLKYDPLSASDIDLSWGTLPETYAPSKSLPNDHGAAMRRTLHLLRPLLGEGRRFLDVNQCSLLGNHKPDLGLFGNGPVNEFNLLIPFKIQPGALQYDDVMLALLNGERLLKADPERLSTFSVLTNTHDIRIWHTAKTPGRVTRKLFCGTLATAGEERLTGASWVHALFNSSDLQLGLPHRMMAKGQPVFATKILRSEPSLVAHAKWRGVPCFVKQGPRVEKEVSILHNLQAQGVGGGVTEIEATEDSLLIMPEYSPVKKWDADLISQALHILRQVHSCGCLHRDIRPSNWLMKGSELRLIDWDCALGSDMTTRDEKHRLVASVPVGFCGTPFYASTSLLGDLCANPESTLPCASDDLESCVKTILYACIPILQRVRMPTLSAQQILSLWAQFGKVMTYWDRLMGFCAECQYEELARALPEYLCLTICQ
eukprot:gnl/Trimastix_PCT/3014.p1 GENE.gnl/Trimastix_PCT/3014~~gnl/Trimastix_PCT/3014.p1  ORF type:complete len:477 (+),score=4.89 gnl/Trimastix_PCT/3014:66-1433(+)